jgi:hypothetical protein
MFDSTPSGLARSAGVPVDAVAGVQQTAAADTAVDVYHQPGRCKVSILTGNWLSPSRPSMRWYTEMFQQPSIYLFLHHPEYRIQDQNRPSRSYLSYQMSDNLRIRFCSQLISCPWILPYINVNHVSCLW